LLDLFSVGRSGLPNPLGLTRALALSLLADVGDLLIELAQASFKLREPLLRLQLVALGLFEFLDD
jgi:hypothetical protein